MFWNKLNKKQKIDKEVKVVNETNQWDVIIYELCKKRKAISDCNNMLKFIYEVNTLEHVSKRTIKRLCSISEDDCLDEKKRIGIMKSRTIRCIDGKIAKFSCKKFGIINKKNKRKSEE